MADFEDDPVYRDSLRETTFILLLWLAAFFWTVSYCYLFGYTEHPRVSGEVSAALPDLSSFDRTSDSLTTPLGLGIPDWVFWGIAVPWLLCAAISTWFAFAFMKDAPMADNETSEAKSA